MSMTRPELHFLAGGGDLGARMRAMDWQATPLGPADAWQAGTEVRYDDLGFDVMDAVIDETTISRLADTLVGLSTAQN